jgi:hypothetical protein
MGTDNEIMIGLCLTQHKRFVPYSNHQNFCFVKTSFILESLYEIGVNGLL